MSYKRILTVQDISCLGQCSMTVALPILSACGLEVCVLPSAVLSTHTGGFGDVHFRDLTDDMPAIIDHWKRVGITFDGIYVGYLGSVRQVELVRDICKNLLSPDGACIIDPVMGDHGKLYAGFDESYAGEMKKLCSLADVLIPNLTELCMLTGEKWNESISGDQVSGLMNRLVGCGAKSVLLTGAEEDGDTTGVALLREGKLWQYRHKKTPKSYHGTGDIFAAAFVGAYMYGLSAEKAAQIAADFTALCIARTFEAPAHDYGVKFEPCLPELMRMLTEK